MTKKKQQWTHQKLREKETGTSFRGRNEMAKRRNMLASFIIVVVYFLQFAIATAGISVSVKNAHCNGEM